MLNKVSILSKIFILSLFFIFFLVPQNVFANTSKYAIIVNPIRGKDFWSNSFSVLNTPENEYKVISSKNLPATWLVRYDALKSEQVDNFLKSLNNKQEVGLFLEITPSLTQDANVKYNQSKNWHYAKSILVIGYTPSDRKKIIDTAFNKFKSIFGYYPKSVGAWWIDAGSLDYMRQKYGVTTSLDVADQYSTDQYQVWGQYWSTPFYPSKNNALIPAQNVNNKIGTVTIQWATRDPYNAYGNGSLDSTFSVQSNDYLTHKLGISYFEKLLNTYFQTTVGLENDFSWIKYGDQYSKQINVLSKNQSSGKLKVETMSNFSETYKSLYPKISPPTLIVSNDPLGSSGKVVWFQTPKYRVGWFYGPYGSAIRDLRTYDDGNQETCLNKACNNLDLSDSFVNAIDDVKYNNQWIIDQGTISNFSATMDSNNHVLISYTNEAGVKRNIKFLDNDIETNGQIQTLANTIIKAQSPNVTHQSATLPLADFKSYLNISKIWPAMGINFIKFIILTIIFFIFPGWIISRRFLYSVPIGWSLFTLISYLLGYLHLNNLIWGIPVLSIGSLFLWGWPKFKFPKITRKLILLIFIVTLGSASWLLTVVRSGLPYNYGLGFWGPNGHDAIWHLSLISELERNFPPQNPVFAGESLNNYHYFFDLLLARSAVLFNLSSLDLLFRFFPLFISFLSGILFFSLSYKIFKNYKVALLSVFFLYFGGGLGWIINLIRYKTWGGESMFWSQQSVSTLLNPPFAISLIFLFTGLLLLYEYFEKKNIRNLLLVTLLLGTVVEFKAYAGVVVLCALSIMALERLIKKDYSLLPVTILSGSLAGAVFLPNNIGSTSLFEFHPFWFVSSMVLFQDRLNWERLSLAMMSNNIFKVFASYTIGFIIFLVGNFGIRIIGFFAFRSYKKAKIIVYMILIGILIPNILTQKGTSWNSIQFMYYSLILSGLISSYIIITISNKLGKVFGILFVTLLLIFTIPTTYATDSSYIPNRPPAKLSYDELQALSFLSTQPKGIVLTMPFSQRVKDSLSVPYPLYAYTSTAYVSAFSNHPVFVEDTVNLNILGLPYQGRVNDQTDFLRFRDQSKNILNTNHISYVYYPRSYNYQFDLGQMGLKVIFENKEVIIYKVI